MSVTLADEELEKLLSGIKIPTPPQIVTDLQMEMAFPDPNIDEMTRLIANDAGLSGAVLKTANSPFYGGNGKIMSINHAVTLLGMNTLIQIVNTVCLKKTTNEVASVPEDLFLSLTRFWDSATDVARMAALVARKLELSSADHLYTLGLFHNIGIALLFYKFDNYQDVLTQSYAEPDRRVVDIENDLLGTNHAVLGYYTARSWKLDKGMCKIIAEHHNDEQFYAKNASKNENVISLAILKIAEHAVGLHKVFGNQDMDVEWNRNGEKVIELSGLTQFEFDEVLDEASDKGLVHQDYFK